MRSPRLRMRHQASSQPELSICVGPTSAKGTCSDNVDDVLLHLLKGELARDRDLLLEGLTEDIMQSSPLPVRRQASLPLSLAKPVGSGATKGTCTDEADNSPLSILTRECERGWSETLTGLTEEVIRSPRLRLRRRIWLSQTLSPSDDVPSVKNEQKSYLCRILIALKLILQKPTINRESSKISTAHTRTYSYDLKSHCCLNGYG